MNYQNISIVHLENGVNILYDSYKQNEISKEIVFFFDENKNYIQKTTYPTNISVFEEESILNNTNSRIYIEEECFFYYSFYYQISYAHYLTQCLPKLKYYFDNLNKIIVVPRATYTNLCKEIFTILGIPEQKILILENNVEYIFKDISTVEHIGSQWHGVGGEVNIDGIEIYKKIRHSLDLKLNKNPHRKIYLKKDGIPNSLYGNGEVGIFRKIENEDELINLLKINGFEIIELGTKSIQEKCQEIEDVHTLISQIGANIMNLIFCNSIKNVLLLSNEFPVGIDFYFNMIDILNPINANKQIFIHPSSSYNVDEKNPTNNPFIVDIDRINNYLQSIQ